MKKISILLLLAAYSLCSLAQDKAKFAVEMKDDGYPYAYTHVSYQPIRFWQVPETGSWIWCDVPEEEIGAWTIQDQDLSHIKKIRRAKNVQQINLRNPLDGTNGDFTFLEMNPNSTADVGTDVEVQFSPYDADDKGYYISSTSNSGVVSYSLKRLFSHHRGEATITITANDGGDYAHIYATVGDIPTSMTENFSRKAVVLPGEEMTLEGLFTFTPEGVNTHDLFDLSVSPSYGAGYSEGDLWFDISGNPVKYWITHFDESDIGRYFAESRIFRLHAESPWCNLKADVLQWCLFRMLISPTTNFSSDGIPMNVGEDVMLPQNGVMYVRAYCLPNTTTIPRANTGANNESKLQKVNTSLYNLASDNSNVTIEPMSDGVTYKLTFTQNDAPFTLSTTTGHMETPFTQEVENFYESPIHPKDVNGVVLKPGRWFNVRDIFDIDLPDSELKNITYSIAQYADNDAWESFEVERSADGKQVHFNNIGDRRVGDLYKFCPAFKLKAWHKDTPEHKATQVVKMKADVCYQNSQGVWQVFDTDDWRHFIDNKWPASDHDTYLFMTYAATNSQWNYGWDASYSYFTMIDNTEYTVEVDRPDLVSVLRMPSSDNRYCLTRLDWGNLQDAVVNVTVTFGDLQFKDYILLKAE